jgi:hypothetical protein
VVRAVCIDRAVEVAGGEWSGGGGVVGRDVSSVVRQ